MKLRVTLVVDYNPVPGQDGYEDCETLADCLELDQSIFDQDVVGFIEGLASAYDRADEIDAGLELLGDSGYAVR
jgi:hypothetical protein